jgi:hypothetical protein
MELSKPVQVWLGFPSVQARPFVLGNQSESTDEEGS